MRLKVCLLLNLPPVLIFLNWPRNAFFWMDPSCCMEIQFYCDAKAVDGIVLGINLKQRFVNR
jgi:hypothetical protein